MKGYRTLLVLLVLFLVGLTACTTTEESNTNVPEGGNAANAEQPEGTAEEAVVEAPTEVAGALCVFAGTGSTVTADDKRLNFLCQPEGVSEVGLFGEIEAGDEGWMIERAVFVMGPDGAEPESTEMAQVLGIHLYDGSECLFAGTGATVAIDGKRLNFSCEAEGDHEVGLFGDVEIGDDGWMIERAVFSMGPDGAVKETSAMVVIQALRVPEPEE